MKDYRKQQAEHKGLRIAARLRAGFTFYYAIIYRPDGSIVGRVDRDEEGGIPCWEMAVELAKHEIDQGYHG